MIIYESPKKATPRQIGSKACSLAHLQEIGIAVPEWFAISVNCFIDFIYNHRDAYINLINHYSEAKRKKFVKLLEGTDFTVETKQEVLKAIGRHFNDNDRLSIRTSVTDETSKHPYIGTFESYMFVKPNEKIFEYIKKCYISCFSEKIMSFRANYKLLNHNLGVAIIIQKTIDSDYSGIIYTTNPRTNNTTETLITVAPGLNRRNAFYEQSCDSVLLSGEEIKTDMSKTKYRIPNDIVLKLQKLGQTIEKSYNPRVAQDIEFAIKDGNIYILQTRPIPNYINIDKHKTHIILDSTKLNNSLRGITTPLTYSFVKDLYRKTQTQILRNKHVSDEDISQAERCIDRAVCFYENKIYLREDYHKTIASLYKNKGKKIRISKYSHLKINNHVSDSVFNRLIQPYENNDFQDYTNLQLIETYRDLESELFNDFVEVIMDDEKIEKCQKKLSRLLEKANIYNSHKIIKGILAPHNTQILERNKQYVEIIKEIGRDPRLV